MPAAAGCRIRFDLISLVLFYVYQVYFCSLQYGISFVHGKLNHCRANLHTYFETNKLLHRVYADLLNGQRRHVPVSSECIKKQSLNVSLRCGWRLAGRGAAERGERESGGRDGGKEERKTKAKTKNRRRRREDRTKGTHSGDGAGKKEPGVRASALAT